MARNFKTLVCAGRAGVENEAATEYFGAGEDAEFFAVIRRGKRVDFPTAEQALAYADTLGGEVIDQTKFGFGTKAAIAADYAKYGAPSYGEEDGAELDDKATQRWNSQ